MSRRFAFRSCVVALGLLLGAALRGRGEGVFALREVEVFGEAIRDPWAASALRRGQRVACSHERNADVKAYPPLVSSRPLYGAAELGRSSSDVRDGVTFHFVIDESRGAAKGYDRLYFDENGDRDLTNDGARGTTGAPPTAETEPVEAEQSVYFERLTVPFDAGLPLGPMYLRVVPRLLVWDAEHAAVFFAACTAFEGRLKIGGRTLDAVLGQPYVITGRFDRPLTGLYLASTEEGGQLAHWWGGDHLSAMHEIGGALYCFAATPTGEELTVRRYRGDFGILELGAGGRRLKALGMRGSLRSRTAGVRVGGPDGSPDGDVRWASIPVGDYLPAYLIITFGGLRLGLSDNYHTEGHPRDRQGRPNVHGLRVRKGEPFVLDFPNKPAVVFASPRRGQRFKRGEEIPVKGILVDPVLDVMIRGLEDTRRKQSSTSRDEDGEEHTYQSDLSLDPKVALASSTGEVVARGVMPFG